MAQESFAHGMGPEVLLDKENATPVALDAVPIVSKKRKRNVTRVGPASEDVVPSAPGTRGRNVKEPALAADDVGTLLPRTRNRNASKVKQEHTVEEDLKEEASPVAAPPVSRTRSGNAKKVKSGSSTEEVLEKKAIPASTPTKSSNRRRGAKQGTPGTAIKSEKDSIVDIDATKEPPKKKPKRGAKNNHALESSNVKDNDQPSANISETPKIAKKENKWPWFGKDPYPDHKSPTPAQCYEVHDILTALHGPRKPPTEIPPPSLEVAGCGQVPDVLDAMLRTRLSAATTSRNAGYAIQGLVDAFGKRKIKGCAESINWEAVHAADEAEVRKAIHRGGLALAKAHDIKLCLQEVYDTNLARREALLREQETGENADVIGADSETQQQKASELARFKYTLLTLDHLLELPTELATKALIQYKGIGIKTASCVILFCFRRPSFAVDTHILRLCRWLDWVPAGADAEKTFAHCDLLVPDELKYGLHQLLMSHGKACGRCRAITSAGTEGWEATVCPLEGLVKRSGGRKGGAVVVESENGGGKKAVRRVVGKGKKAVVDDEDEEDGDGDGSDGEDDDDFKP